MHEIPKILTEKEFAKRLQLAKETLNEYNCKNDIEKGLIVMSGWVSADGQPVYTPAQLKRLFDLVYKGDDTDGTSYHASRNMPLKEPEEERFVQWREIKDRKGYYLDKNTYYEGTNKFTGYKYRYYTMIKLDRRI